MRYSSGFKHRGKIAIRAEFFRFAYERYIENHDLNHLESKITTTLVQYLKELKLSGILSHDSDRLTRTPVFGRDKDGNPIKPLCYVFKVDASVTDDDSEGKNEPVDTPSIDVTVPVVKIVSDELDLGKAGGGV